MGCKRFKPLIQQHEPLQHPPDVNLFANFLYAGCTVYQVHNAYQRFKSAFPSLPLILGINSMNFSFC